MFAKLRSLFAKPAPDEAEWCDCDECEGEGEEREMTEAERADFLQKLKEMKATVDELRARSARMAAFASG